MINAIVTLFKTYLKIIIFLGLPYYMTMGIVTILDVFHKLPSWDMNTVDSAIIFVGTLYGCSQLLMVFLYHKIIGLKK